MNRVILQCGEGNDEDMQRGVSFSVKLYNKFILEVLREGLL